MLMLPKRARATLLRVPSAALAALPSIALVLLSLVAFDLFRNHAHVLGLPTADRIGVALGVIAAGALVRMKSLPPSVRILIHTVNVIASGYVLTSYPSIPNERISIAGWEINRWVAGLAGLIGIARPAFVLLPLTFLTWSKRELAKNLGLALAIRDYTVVVEVGVFVVLAVILHSYGRTASAWASRL